MTGFLVSKYAICYSIFAIERVLTLTLARRIRNSNRSPEAGEAIAANQELNRSSIACPHKKLVMKIWTNLSSGFPPTKNLHYPLHHCASLRDSAKKRFAIAHHT